MTPSPWMAKILEVYRDDERVAIHSEDRRNRFHRKDGSGLVCTELQYLFRNPEENLKNPKGE